MMMLIKIFKNIYTYIIAAFGIVLGLFFLERNRRQQAEIGKLKAEAKTVNAVTTFQQEQSQIILELKKQQLEDQNKETISSPLTPEEAEEYWKKK